MRYTINPPLYQPLCPFEIEANNETEAAVMALKLQGQSATPAEADYSSGQVFQDQDGVYRMLIYSISGYALCTLTGSTKGIYRLFPTMENPITLRKLCGAVSKTLTPVAHPEIING